MKLHNPQNSSLHLFLGLPLGLFPATCPFITLFTRLPSFSIISSLHIFLLLFICATTASCFNLSLIASFLTHSNLVTPTTLLRTFISAACNLVLSLSFNTHVSQPYTSVGTTTALYTVILHGFTAQLIIPETVFLRDPTTVAALPILLSNSLSILPFPLNLTLRYTVCLAFALAAHSQFYFTLSGFPTEYHGVCLSLIYHQTMSLHCFMESSHTLA